MPESHPASSRATEAMDSFLKGFMQIFNDALGFVVNRDASVLNAGKAGDRGNASTSRDALGHIHLDAGRYAEALAVVIQAAYTLNEPMIIRNINGRPSAILTEWPSLLSEFRSVWIFPFPWTQASAILVLLHKEDKAPNRSEWQHCIWYASHVRMFFEHHAEAIEPDMSALYPFISQLEKKDSFTAGHSVKVASYAAQLAIAVGLPAQEVRHVYLGAILHDIGKLDIRSEVLLKPSRLTEEEFAEVRLHPVFGERYLHLRPDLTIYQDIVRHHHERLDGRGYPDGLSGGDISLSVRIVAVADAFDAMTSHRVYRSSLSKLAAVHELRRHAGTQFDGTLVHLFERCVRFNPYLRVGAGNTPLQSPKLYPNARK